VRERGWQIHVTILGMELFLTSTISKAAQNIGKGLDLSVRNKLVFVDTAAEPKEERSDMQWLADDRQALVDAGFDVSDYTITNKTKDKLEKDLESYDFIYMSGGDTAYLLKQSQDSGFIDVVKDFVANKGKIYIGTSAGSIIAGPKLPDYFEEGEYGLKNENCYGFVNFTILPHWGTEYFKKKYLDERLKLAYKDNQLPLLILTDNQYVHIKNKEMEIVCI